MATDYDQTQVLFHKIIFTSVTCEQFNDPYV